MYIVGWEENTYTTHSRQLHNNNIQHLILKQEAQLNTAPPAILIVPILSRVSDGLNMLCRNRFVMVGTRKRIGSNYLDRLMIFGR